MKISNFKKIGTLRQLTSRLLLLSALCIFIFSLNAKAQYDPSSCDGKDNWIGPITAVKTGLPYNVIGCFDNDCEITIQYYKRYNYQGGFPSWELQLYSVEYKNCDPSCIIDPWKAGFWMIITAESATLNLFQYSNYILDFSFKAATCWHIEGISASNSKVTSCGSECCWGIYGARRFAGVTGDSIEITKFQTLTQISNNCNPPQCQFIDCESTLPAGFNVTAVNVGSPISVSYPKLSVYDFTHLKSLTISPIPSSEKVNLNIYLPNEGLHSICIFDYIGNIIYKSDINISNNHDVNLEINTSKYAVGIYNVIISDSNGEILSSKFIKSK